jgi:two-component system cell cycle sensor histidine kinase/response regulator CckA
MIDDFQRMAQNSPDALAAVSADGGIHFANRRFNELFFPDRHRFDAFHLNESCPPPPLREALIANIENAVQSGIEKQLTIDTRMGTQDRTFFCRILPGSEAGKTHRALLEVRDVTVSAGRQATFKPKDDPSHRISATGGTRRDFFSVLDKFPAFVYMQRRDYTVAYANKKVRDLYGETESRLCYEVFAGRETPCPVCPTFDVFETGESIEWEFTDEKDRTFHIYDYPYEDEMGNPLVMELGIDITDLKRVETELFQAQKLRAIGVLAGGLAHDLNNNLVPIIFNIDHALAWVSEDAAREPLKEALHAAYRAAKLVEQVLDYSRQQDIRRAPLHLIPLLRESIEAFKCSLNPDIRLEIDIDARHDSVSANAMQIRQIMQNLLRNAEQAMPEGGVVAVALEEEAVANRDGRPPREHGFSDHLVLTVRDTGVGIPAQDVERIFEPFFTTKKTMGGTGMGLAVVHSIVSSSGGAITVDSAEGEGTLFTIRLPKAPAPPPLPADETCAMQGNCSRLLLVDDDPGALSAMARTLRNANFEVQTATSGEAGLEMFARHPDRFGLILADQSMPGMNGIEMATRMLAGHHAARIIICTGHVEPALEKEAREKGVADFAIKPMNPQRLVELVKRYCL